MIERLLITGANGDIADAIARIITSEFPSLSIDGSDMGGDWPARSICSQVHTLPAANDENYLSHLLAIADTYRLIMPATDAECRKIALEWDNIPDNLRQRLVINQPRLVKIFSDKFETYKFLSQNAINMAPSVDADNTNDVREISLPAIAKPKIGNGSKGILRMESADELSAFMAKKQGGYVIQKYIPDYEGEFTCSIIKLPGYSASITLKRKLLGGLTGTAEVVNIPTISKLLADITSCLPEVAFINVQLRMEGGIPWVFEINPRISSTAMMRHLLGFSDVKWLINHLLHSKIPESDYKPPVGSKVFRMSRELVVPASGQSDSQDG